MVSDKLSEPFKCQDACQLVGLGCFRNSLSQGRKGYHIYHWQWSQSLKSSLRCLRLVFTGLGFSEFRAGISPLLNKTGKRGSLPLYLFLYINRAASDDKVFVLRVFAFHGAWSPRIGLPTREVMDCVNCKEWACQLSECGSHPGLVNSLIV